MNRFENITQTVHPSATVGATVNGSDMENRYGRGVRLYLDVTAVSGTSPTLDVTFEAKDPLSGTYYTIPLAVFTQATAAVEDTLSIYPGIAVVANESVNDFLPREWRAVYTIGGSMTPTVTFSLSACYML